MYIKRKSFLKFNLQGEKILIEIGIGRAVLIIDTFTNGLRPGAITKADSAENKVGGDRKHRKAYYYLLWFKYATYLESVTIHTNRSSRIF